MHQREFICYLSEGFRSSGRLWPQRQQIGSDIACGRNIAVFQSARLQFTGSLKYTVPSGLRA
jgi:hypothetical protein